MKKTLDIKTQVILPKLNEKSNSIAKALIVEPEDAQTLETKGTIYTTFDISGQNKFETELLTRIVQDVLYDSYFRSEDSNPIQALEKTVLKLRDNVTKLSRGENGIDDPTLSFNITAIILWGNTLYAVQYGATKTYLLRDGNVKQIDTASEGKFSVSSGTVKDNDIVMLATESFAKKFPPEQLTALSKLSAEDLETTDASLIMKFSVKQELSDEEKLSIKTPANKAEVENKKVAPTKKASSKIKLPNVSKYIKKVKSIRISKKSRNIILGIVVVLTLLWALVWGIRQIAESEWLQNLRAPDNKEILLTSGTKQEEEPPANEEVSQESTPNIFYDLRLADQSIEPTQLVQAGTNLYVLDENTNELYVSSISTPRFVKITRSFETITKILNLDGEIAIVESGDLVILDDTTYQESELFLSDLESIVTTYLDFVYQIKDDSIIRYSRGESRLNDTVWTQDALLNNAIDFGIDVSIFVLVQDGINKYTTGTRVPFEIQGLETPINNPKAIIVDIDLQNVYVADSGNNRVVVIDKDGEFVATYTAPADQTWENIQAIEVSADETMLYVLDNTRIYEVPLE